MDAVLISSAFAGGGFISPRQYERFVLPYEAEVVRRIHAAGVPVYTHTCGDIGDRLERMVETGIDGIDTLDPPPLGSVDLADAKRRVGDRVFFKGNIDAVNTLLKKSREEVRADALARLRIGGSGGGYILSSACSVAPAFRRRISRYWSRPAGSTRRKARRGRATVSARLHPTRLDGVCGTSYNGAALPKSPPGLRTQRGAAAAPRIVQGGQQPGLVARQRARQRQIVRGVVRAEDAA